MYKRQAYDRFYFLDKPCSFNGSADDTVDTLSFPATHQDLLSYIGKINDFTISAKSNDFAKIKTKPVFNSEATNPTNKYYTYREIIGFIAACNGCNAQFDANDKLIFTRPSNSVETIEEGDCESLSAVSYTHLAMEQLFNIGNLISRATKLPQDECVQLMSATVSTDAATVGKVGDFWIYSMIVDVRIAF